jgi:hypothetical protein
MGRIFGEYHEQVSAYEMNRLQILAFLWLLLGCSAMGAELQKETVQLLIAEVDRIKLPLDETKLKEGSTERGEGDFTIRLDNPDLLKNKDLKEGFLAILVGSKEKPAAVLFYIDSVAGEPRFLIPFKGVSKMPQKWRLEKLGERLYRVHSNRSRSGTFTDRLDEVKP